MSQQLDSAISNARVNQNIDTRTGYLGRGDGFPYDSANPGNLWVRFKLGTRFTAPVSMPADPNANLDIRDGFAVEVGKRSGRDIILRADRGTMELSGDNALRLNPHDPVHSVTAARLLGPFYFHRHGDVTNQPHTVSVWPNYSYTDNAFTRQGGLKIDLSNPLDDGGLSSLIPDADEHCFAVVFCRGDNVLEAYRSAPVAMSIDLTWQDCLDECAAQSTIGSQPICAVYLSDAQASLNDNEDQWIDLRQFVNNEQEWVATVSTSDATPTTVASVAIAEAEVVTLTGTVVAYKSDFSAAAGGTFTATVRRPTAGNVALVAVSATVLEDSGSSPTFTVDVDTGTQTARVRWTGVASEDWTVKVKYETLRGAA